MALAHAILSNLLVEPASGYDLTKRFDSSVGFFWKAKHQQIYRELTRLEALRWLSSETIHQESRPDKKLFWVTELGKEAMREWIMQPSDVAAVRDDLLVKLFAGHLVSPDVLSAALEQHQSQHQQRLTDYQAIEQQYFANPQDLDVAAQLRYMTLQYGIAYEIAWLAWCDRAIDQLTAQAGYDRVSHSTLHDASTNHLDTDTSQPCS